MTKHIQTYNKYTRSTFVIGMDEVVLFQIDIYLKSHVVHP